MTTRQGTRGAGRPSEGLGMIERLGGGTAESRRRLDVIVRSLSGDLTVEQACGELGLEKSRFHEIRRAFLLAAPTLLEPGVPGPVPRSVNAEVEQLRRENEALRTRATMAELREELQILNAAEPAASPPKTTVRRAKKKKRTRTSRTRRR